VINIGIVDHGAGNLVSIANAVRAVGAKPEVMRSPEGFGSVDALVLPGVGATAPAMSRLTASGMVPALSAWDGPLLGICVGFQLLFDNSDEDGQACLGLIGGSVRPIAGRPIPHMGWNDVSHSMDPLFADIPDREPFYFAHSFAPVPTDEAHIIATADYGQRFVGAARFGNRVGVQFHPERSGIAGLRLLSNFVEGVRESARVA
jgi:imidazole glycerol phosphate synthase glutamine amidotransferase subunit